MRRYKNEDRPCGICYDCGLDYTKFSCDMVIQDELWELINPTYCEDAGLLCPNCICTRLMQLPEFNKVYVKVDIHRSRN